MYPIEICRKGSDVVGPMIQMREWLDARRVRPALFTMSNTTNGIVFHLQFVTAIEAAVAAHALGGRVIIDRAADAA